YSSLQYHLKTHMEKEEDRLPFKCNDCGRRFSQKGNLERHGNSHLVDGDPRKKIYQCDVCDKSFAWKSTLQQHILSHIGVTATCAATTMMRSVRG
ncbi:hypothetical protein PMAYCL1PPCAC_05046, partial [Pristionchus mayeri]